METPPAGTQARLRFPLSTFHFSLLLFAVCALGGCGGPTKAGIEARKQANDRVNLVSAQLTYDQAQQAFNTGQFQRALIQISNAIEKFPDSCKFYVLLGRIQLETHKLEQSIEAFEIAMEKDPKSAEPHYYEGIIYQRWSNDSKAYEQYAKAFELDPSNVQYLLASAEAKIDLHEYEAARALISEHLNFFEHNAAMRHLLGQIALLQNNPSEAVKHYTEARMLAPEDTLLLEELARAQFRAGQYSKCHESLRLLNDMPGDERTDLIVLQARCLAELNRAADARDLYLQLSRQAPASSDPAVWIGLGMTSWELGDMRRVAQSGQQLVSIVPDRYEGYVLKALYEKNRGDLDAALKLMNQAAARAGDNALPFLLLGQTLQDQGDTIGAIEAYAAAVDADPSNTMAQSMLAAVEAYE